MFGKNHYVKILHVRLGGGGDPNNMHPLNWGGGTNGKDPIILTSISFIEKNQN